MIILCDSNVSKPEWEQESQQTMMGILKVWCMTNDAGYTIFINAYYFSPKSQWIVFHAVEHGKQVALQNISEHLSVNLFLKNCKDVLFFVFSLPRGSGSLKVLQLFVNYCID